MRIPAIALLLLFIVPAAAQHKLSASRQTSQFKYVYRINPVEALKLYRSALGRINQSYLHTLVDSFDAVSIESQLPEAGNYIVVHANKNRLEYSLETKGDVTLKLVDNGKDVNILLHDNKGRFIKDAKLFIDRKAIPFETVTQSYHGRRKPGAAYIHVLYRNVLYFFPIEKPKKYNERNFLYRLSRAFPLKYITQPVRKRLVSRRMRHDYFQNNTPYEKSYHGYMVFSKPVYKPGDTVRLKAYVVNKKGKGVSGNLLLRLTSEGFSTDTIIATIKPYRMGGYAYEFVLSDSLNIDLDDKYLLTLEEEGSRKYDINEYDGELDEDDYAMKRKVVMRGFFSYEEYELKAVHFKARIDKDKHNRLDPVSIYLKATDENDLAVMDGRVKIIIKRNSYNPVFFAPQVFIPDTLWYHEQSLDALGETKIEIPDSIFPRASFQYSIQCTFLDAENESRSEFLYGQFKGDPYVIHFEDKTDSLNVTYLHLGKSVRTVAKLYGENRNGDTVLGSTLNLPAVFLKNQFVKSYYVVTDSCEGVYEASAGNGQVSAVSKRTRDSVFIEIVNPNHLNFWYTLSAGKKVVAEGYTAILRYAAGSKTRKNYLLSLHYVYADKMLSDDYTIPFQEKLLNVEVKQPAFVYPGLKADISVSVSDADGKAVAGADLSAYAFTSKFENASAPFIPYLGKIYPGRKSFKKMDLSDEDEYNITKKLDWQRWSKEMNLDSIEYYKFLHPQVKYINYEPAKDSLTQFAPFVVKDGEIIPIQIIYVDEVPIYFSQAENLQGYSFRLSNGKHKLRLRTSTQEITIDIKGEQGKKLFLSVDATAKDSSLRILSKPNTLTNDENLLLRRYFLVVENNFREHYAYIKQEDRIFPINFSALPVHQVPSRAWVGPVYNRYAELFVKHSFSQVFTPEGNYVFHFEPGLIKQKQLDIWDQRGAFTGSTSSGAHLSDAVLTESGVDSLWRRYLDNRNANEDIFKRSTALVTEAGTLQISLDSTPVFVRNIFLFRNDDPEYLSIYKGGERNLGLVEEGKYRLFFLLRKDEYFLMENLVVKKSGLNFFDAGKINIKKKDSISEKLSHLVDIAEKYTWDNNSSSRNQITETFNSKFLDKSSFTRTVHGTVRNEKGVRIPFVSITIRGTAIVAVADEYGNFTMQTPERGVLVVSAVGYHTEEADLRTSNSYNFRLRETVMALREVVVVGYGTMTKKNMTASVSTITGSAQGIIAGVHIRGAASRALPTPLIMVDGLPFAGRMEDLDPSFISAKVLDGDAAMAIYGSAAAGGVIIITTNKKVESSETNETPPDPPAGSLRRNFKDDAFWQPRLITDAEGKVSFPVVFPDDITSWRTFVIAMADKKRTGFSEGLIKSFKALSANIKLPQFIVEGDSLQVIAKGLNYLPDAINVRRKFSVDDSVYSDKTISFKNALIDSFAIVAKSSDSIRFKYTIQKEDGYFDGEERSLPVFKPGVLETKGMFAALHGDTSFSFTPDPTLGKIIIHAEAAILPVLLDETEKIRNYEYLCNEQIASKLKALLLQKRIMGYFGKDFKYEKNIRELITRLNKSQKQGLWGWWAENDPLPWVSLHVVEALLLAEKEGYKANLNKQQLINLLVFEIVSAKQEEKLFYLRLLRLLQANVNFEALTDSMKIYIHTTTLYEKLMWMESRQQAGLAIPLDSILDKSKRTVFGNSYWGEDNHKFLDNAIQNTVLMYKLLRQAGNHEDVLASIRDYFLEKRADGQWRNTYESSLILETILPDLLKQVATGNPPSISWDGPGKTFVHAFPFTGEFETGTPFEFVKKGNMPVYLTAYQQGWNKKPTAAENNFAVKTKFERKGAQLTVLKGGEAVILKVEVIVKADANFVMIEIPVPAGCSYQQKNQSYLNNEVHREYFKNKVSIFCSSLKAGNYYFEISLMPRFSGVFTLNPSKAEMMYFPVFYGRESIRKIVIN